MFRPDVLTRESEIPQYIKDTDDMFCAKPRYSPENVAVVVDDTEHRVLPSTIAFRRDMYETQRLLDKVHPSRNTPTIPVSSNRPRFEDLYEDLLRR